MGDAEVGGSGLVTGCSGPDGGVGVGGMGGAMGDNVSRFQGFNQTSSTPVLIESGTLQIGPGTQTGKFEFLGATLELFVPSTNPSINFNAGSA